MRVIAGEARGRRLKAPPREGVRPTSDQLRERLFNVLGARVEGARFLDLYAGTGAVGIEALSRGAARVTFIEENRRHIALIRENLARTVVVDRAEVLCGQVERLLSVLARSGKRFDIVFLDPPYGAGVMSLILAQLHRFRLVTGEGVVVAEQFRKEPVVNEAGNFFLSDQRSQGQSLLLFYFNHPPVGDPSR